MATANKKDDGNIVKPTQRLMTTPDKKSGAPSNKPTQQLMATPDKASGPVAQPPVQQTMNATRAPNPNPLSYEDWLKQNPANREGEWAVPGIGNGWTGNSQHAYKDNYLKNFKRDTGTTTPPVQTPSNAPIVPGEPTPGKTQNVVDYTGNLVQNPSNIISGKHSLANNVPNIDPNTQGTNVNANDPRFANNPGQFNQNAAQAGQVDPRNAVGYNAQTTQQNMVNNNTMQGARGQLSQGSIIDSNEVPQLDMQGSATGRNRDGSVNYTGRALNDYARQDISTIIDTSTPAGRRLAQTLGEGNYIDSKATLKGQLDTLQSEFQDAEGNPKIPIWAAGVARSVGKIAAFKGMTGSAATAAMSQALMEASIPIAQQDAQFFQTLTLQNLNNKQAATINKANVLAKFDLTNLDNRMAAAVENAKAFLEMDMANLDNEQQARVINTQNRAQSILEDAKAVNTARMFTANAQNDMNKFYDELNANIKMYNATQTNDMRQFNSSLSNQRDEFYKNMQYNIDVGNAKWRQTVTLAESEMAFEAAATDVKNMVGISQEALNRLWDRSDSLLDYLWQSTEKQLDRKAALVLQSKRLDAEADMQDSAGWGSVFGSILGSLGGKVAGAAGDSIADWLF